MLVVDYSDMFATQLAALSGSRSVRTRQLAQAEGNVEMTRTVKLAEVNIYMKYFKRLTTV